MAARVGAGTGVIVSLVVFVLTTVFLLVMTIVFYARQTDAIAAKAESEKKLEEYVTRAEQTSDAVKRIQGDATTSRQSVLGYNMGQYRELMSYAGGDPAMTLADLKASMGRYGVAEDAVVANYLAEMKRAVNDRTTEIEDLTARLEDARNQVAECNARLQQQETDHETELQQLTSQIATYRQSADDYKAEVDKLRDTMNEAIAKNRGDYEGQISDLQTEIDRLGQEAVVMRGRINEYETLLSNQKLRASDPSSMIDGRIIDVAGADQVFIDLGKKQRVVLGMTFEVFDHTSSIQVDQRTGELVRGKSSIQVIKVGDTTSTGKVLRSTPGRPIVRNDVIANAIYDKDYRFKFLVHGKFDIDGDGRATEEESNYLRSLVKEWGGVSVEGDELPGDLDFLILGVQPPLPAPPRPDAPQIEIEAWLAKRQAYEQYKNLQRQAMEAQIPVLNANRFLILIGFTQR